MIQFVRNTDNRGDAHLGYQFMAILGFPLHAGQCGAKNVCRANFAAQRREAACRRPQEKARATP